MIVVVLDWVATLWGMGVALSPWLQIRAIRKAGSSDAVSLGFLVFLGIGCLWWALHGLAHHDLYVAVPNAVGAVMTAITVGVAVAYRRRERVKR